MPCLDKAKALQCQWLLLYSAAMQNDDEFTDDDFFDDDEPTGILALQREYPVMVTFADGREEATISVYAIYPDSAFRFFDEMFMQWHLTRRFFELDLLDLSFEYYHGAVRIDMYSPDREEVLASYELLERESGGDLLTPE